MVERRAQGASFILNQVPLVNRRIHLQKDESRREGPE